MPTWNAEQFLSEAVDSILCQTFSDIELIVIDGGSKDRTLEILSRYRDARLRVVAAPGPGIVPALNFGIQQARAPWIARQDADDISLPHRLEAQWNALNADAKAILCHTDAEFIGEGRESAGRARFPRTQAFVALKLCWHCAIIHSTVMFNKEAALAAGGYRLDEQNAEDYGLWGRLMEGGGCVGIRQRLLKFRIHPTSASNRNRERMLALTERIGVEHCRRFMRLSAEEAKRANAVLLAGEGRRWPDWAWFLGRCMPRLRWKSAEACAWLGLQSLKMLR